MTAAAGGRPAFRIVGLYLIAMTNGAASMKGFP